MSVQNNNESKHIFSETLKEFFFQKYNELIRIQDEVFAARPELNVNLFGEDPDNFDETAFMDLYKQFKSSQEEKDITTILAIKDKDEPTLLFIGPNGFFTMNYGKVLGVPTIIFLAMNLKNHEAVAKSSVWHTPSNIDAIAAALDACLKQIGFMSSDYDSIVPLAKTEGYRIVVEEIKKLAVAE